MFQRHKHRHGSHFPVSAVAAAWKGIIKSATEAQGAFPCLTFSGGKKCFDFPQLQLR